MYNVCGKLLNGIRIYTLIGVRAEWNEGELFRIDSSVTQGCVMSLRFSICA